MSHTTPSHDAWTDALPGVLALLTAHQQDLFRRELQRFLAWSRFQPADAEALAGPLREMLLSSVRAAKAPAAINATRTMPGDVDSLAALAEHILARWRDAQEKSRDLVPGGCAEDGLRGTVFFGPRLGGPGRGGAIRRAGAPDDGGPET